MPLLAAALPLVLSAALQAGGTADEPEIVVEAPATPRERRLELRDMASNVIASPRPGQPMPTYFDAICPRVIGLPEVETKVIVDRIRENAEALGANRRTPSRRCEPNLTVIFVPASKGPPEDWVTSENDMIGHLLDHHRREILGDPNPVRAWSYIAMRSADGGKIVDAHGQKINGPLEFGNSVRSMSRLRMDATAEIVSSVVMIELAAAQGKTLGQLADYASMRSFGNARGIDPQTPPAAPTILSLFQDADAPETLTSFDRALVSKLYSMPRTALERRYYSSIAARALAKEEESGS